MSNKRIIGFTNPHHFLPMYVVIMYVSGERVFSRHPKGEDRPIANMTEEKFISRDGVIPVGDKIFLLDNEIAFAVSKDEVYIEPLERIMEIIKDMLVSGRFKDDEEITEVLEELLVVG